MKKRISLTIICSIALFASFYIGVSAVSNNGFSLKNIFNKNNSDENSKSQDKDELYEIINSAMQTSRKVDEDCPTEEVLAGVTVLPEDVDVVANELDRKLTRYTNSNTEEEIRKFEKVGIALTESYVDVKEQPNDDANAVGIMCNGAFASILAKEGEWYKIKSGNVEGYIKEDNFQNGEDALFLLKEYVKSYATITKDGKVGVTKDSDTKSDEVAKVSNGEKYEVLEQNEDWLYILIGKSTKGYIPSDTAQISQDYALAISSSEEADMIKAEKNAKSQASSGGYNGAVMSLPADVYAEFVALIFCESGGQPLNGKIAVAQVVLNRVASGKYPNSVHAVIYQKSQFGPVNTGIINGKIKLFKSGGFTSTNHKECITAANTALDGKGKGDIGDRLHFNGYAVEKDKNHPSPVRIQDHLFW